MKVFHTVEEVIQWRQNGIGDRRSISVGFIPTMGCLHEGHASLIQASKRENNYTVVSIFVNPSQFAPTEDLDQYPRTFLEDSKLLESFDVDVLFAPAPSVIYPQGIPLVVSEQRGPFVSVLGVSEVLEGSTRPTFFRGVATVVTKLLNIVMPDFAYFGQKDIQQFTVLSVMVDELFINTKLRMMPIIRSSTGLALSSRNKYLCPESLGLAATLYKGLKSAEENIKSLKDGETLTRTQIVDQIKNIWESYIRSNDFKSDYVSVAQWGTLKEVDRVQKISNSPAYIISCAVYVTDRGENKNVVRLIDNIIL